MRSSALPIRWPNPNLWPLIRNMARGLQAQYCRVRIAPNRGIFSDQGRSRRYRWGRQIVWRIPFQAPFKQRDLLCGKVWFVPINWQWIQTTGNSLPACLSYQIINIPRKHFRADLTEYKYGWKKIYVFFTGADACMSKLFKLFLVEAWYNIFIWYTEQA